MNLEYVGATQIIIGVLVRFWPVWIALAIVLGASIFYKKQLGLYGQLFNTGVGIAGVTLCFFWLFTAIFASTISPFDPIAQVAVMKDALPGAVVPDTAGVEAGKVYLFGGDKLSRDVFSRMVFGSQIVLVIAPAATAFALMVGVTLGLPAGYYGGKIDSFLSFLANLVLAFPVILLFYLLVTPAIQEMGIPRWMAGVFFLFPIVFFLTLFYTRFKNRPDRLGLYIGLDAGHRRLDLCFAGVQRRSVRPAFDQPQRAEHLRGCGVCLQPRRVPHRSRPRHRLLYLPHILNPLFPVWMKTYSRVSDYTFQ